MSVAEFNEWRVYEHVHPFGERRDDLRFGILSALIVNLFKALYSKHSSPAKPKDFMLPWDPEQPETPEQQLTKFTLIAQIQNMLVENQKRA